MKTVEAFFHGKTFQPNEPVALKPNTWEGITIETMQPAKGEADR